MTAALAFKAKVDKVTNGLFQLGKDYIGTEGPNDKKIAKVIHEANLNLPDASKALLYDLLTAAE